MTDNQKNLLVTIGVCVGALAVVFGIQTRDRLDLGVEGNRFSQSGALASMENERDIPAEQYFDRLTSLLKKEYVDEVHDDMKLASGAVRGMILSLGDTHSVYYDEKTFPVFMKELSGTYEGIGADLVFVREKVSSDLGDSAEGGTKLMVASVVPGGPADRAGVKTGYWVDSVNDIWVLNPSLRDQVAEGKKLLDKKPKTPADEAKFREIRTEIREKLRTYMPPLRARERLTTGDSGEIKVVWHTPAGLVTTNIAKAVSNRPNFEVKPDGSIAFRFVPGSDSKLAEAVKDKSAVTLDLRGVSTGDYSTMRKCLEAIAAKGQYGYLAKEGDAKAIPIEIKQGVATTPQITILANKGTQGVAEVFAKALVAAGKAKIEGETGNDPVASEIIKLPTGSGYTLAIGKFQGGGK